MKVCAESAGAFLHAWQRAFRVPVASLKGVTCSFIYVFVHQPGYTAPGSAVRLAVRGSAEAVALSDTVCER